MPFPQKDRHAAECKRCATFAHDGEDNWGQRARGERCGRGVTGEISNREPDYAKAERCWPGGRKKAAEEGRNALSSPKIQPNRKQMAEKSAKRGKKHRIAKRKMRADQNRGGSLEQVKEQGQRGQVLAARAQNICRTNIAGTDCAKVDSDRARQDKSKRNSAAKIAGEKGENALKHAGKPFWPKVIPQPSFPAAARQPANTAEIRH